MTKNERVILFLLAALNFTQLLDFIIMMPLSNYLLPYLKITAFQFSLLVASYSVSAFISGLIIALFVDKFDRKKSLLFAYIGFLAGTLACGFSFTYEFLLASRILAGLFGGIIGAQVLAIVADLFTYERRGRAMGAVVSAFAAATIFGVPLSLYLTNLFRFNWHIPFILIGAIGLVIIPFVIRYIPKMTSHINSVKHDKPFSSLTMVCKIPVQRSALLFTCLLMIGHFLIIPFINPYVEFNKGFSKRMIPMIYLFGGIASMIAAIILGRISDKVGKLPIFLWSVFLSLFMMFIVTNLPNVHFSVIILFFSIWFILATGRALMAQAMVTEVVGSEQRGSFMSINGSIQQLGSGLAALLAGAIVITKKSGEVMNYRYVGYLSIGVLIISMIQAQIVFKKIDKESSKQKTHDERVEEIR
ncbi:MAG: MFS transporter [Bacteroidetes bacterium]|nr:MFS transporter [Bacteroidota bacterium]MBS1930160.1 MFS transporter [Bacteroidota bacterium]